MERCFFIAEGGSMVEFKDQNTGRFAQINFRSFRKGDGEAFRRCIEDFYGGGYPYREYLEEEFILEKCRAGKMLVLCGVTAQGEIVGTSAARLDEEFTGSGILILRVVKEAYRGMGVGKAQEECLFEGVRQFKNLASLYADVMTHNTVSQGSLARRGFVLCGLRLMLYRNEIMVPRLSLPKEGKMSQAVMCRRCGMEDAGLLYCPPEHGDAVQKIYRTLGVKCQISFAKNPPSRKESEIVWKEEPKHHSCILRIRKTGEDVRLLLDSKLRIISRWEDGTLLCYLNLKDPAAVYAYEIFCGAGFFYSGLKPLQTDDEYMLLSYIGGQAVRKENIHLYEGGGKLLSYMLKHRNLLKGGEAIENNQK